jgi:hypothetical protein
MEEVSESTISVAISFKLWHIRIETLSVFPTSSRRLTNRYLPIHESVVHCFTNDNVIVFLSARIQGC